MNINRIPVAFYGKRRVCAPEVSYRYNQKQVIELQGLYGLPAYFRVDFANEGDALAKSVIGTPDGIEVPDEYLLTGKAIKAYIVLGGPDESVQTVYEIDIPVRGRLPVSEETPTPEERSVIDELLAALNNGVEAAEQSAEDAEAWAVGKRGGEPVEDGDETYENNAKYFAVQSAEAKTAAETAKREAEEAQHKAVAAQGKAEDAQQGAETAEKNTEAWAAGTRDGEPVSSDDPAYHNNGAYYLGQTKAAETEALQNIDTAKGAAVGAVNQASTNGVNAVNSAKTQGVTDVNTAKNAAVDEVNGSGPASAKSQAVAAVQQEGSDQVGAVQREGEAQTAAAKRSAEDSEAWAVGTRDGVPVSADDPAYQNNAKYISEHIYITLGVDDYFSRSSENPLQNKFLTPKIAIEDEDGKCYIVTKKVVNGFLVETFTEVTA